MRRSAGVGGGGERIDPPGEVVRRLRRKVRRFPATFDHEAVRPADHLRQAHVLADHL